MLLQHVLMRAIHHAHLQHLCLQEALPGCVKCGLLLCSQGQGIMDSLSSAAGGASAAIERLQRYMQPPPAGLANPSPCCPVHVLHFIGDRQLLLQAAMGHMHAGLIRRQSLYFRANLCCLSPWLSTTVVFPSA